TRPFGRGGMRLVMPGNPNRSGQGRSPVVKGGEVHGTTMPVLVVELQQGDAVVTDHGELSWMSPNISMAPQKGQGLMGRISRGAAGGVIGGLLSGRGI
ncbi:MAG: AIM24 family protein, partial [Acidimicrobiales bacterium]